MANYIYGAVALIGGGTGSLDSINGSDLAENDAAIVFTSNATYIYTLDESSGGSESSPDLITPDSSPENKRWVLVSQRAAESALDTASFAGILDANDDDVQKALDTIDDMFNAGDFTIAAGAVSLDDNVVKAITTDNGTVAVASHSLAITGSGKINTTGSGSAVDIAVDDLTIVTKTSAYTITDTDDIVIGDCSGGNVALTLPQASTKGKLSIFKASSSNTLTIDCYGSETIEAQSSIDLTDEFDCVSLVSNDSNTWVITGTNASVNTYDFASVPSDVTIHGLTTSIQVDVNSVGFGSLLHIDTDGHLIEADANITTAIPCQFMAGESGTGIKTVLVTGIARNDSWDWTPGGAMYVSTTAGTMTQTAPSTTGDRVQIVGYAITADTVLFNPDMTDLEIA